MRVALIHDWLTGMRGGERVLEGLLELFPDAEIFTLVHKPGAVSPRIEARPIHVSALSHIPGAHQRYRFALPIFPRLIEQFDLHGFDLILSSSHCVAKGVRVPPGIPHVCYCHTPMRYVWDQFAHYFGPGRSAAPVRLAAALAAPSLRRWDVRTARRVTSFVANSSFVRQRIRRYYSREAEVIHPPVDVTRFAASAVRDETYVCVSALVPYKRLDVAVEAFNRNGRRLVIAGEGPELSRLRHRARANITFTGHISDAEVACLLGRARAFVLPGEEDFGIAAVEAQAAGTPVIALGRGGALETVIDSADAAKATGIHFAEPTADSLNHAIGRFESLAFDAATLRRNAEQYRPERFRERMESCIAAVLAPSAACALPT